MKILLAILCLFTLGATIIPSFLYASGVMSLETVKLIMLVATVIWFVWAPLWAWQTSRENQKQQ